MRRFLAVRRVLMFNSDFSSKCVFAFLDWSLKLNLVFLPSLPKFHFGSRSLHFFIFENQFKLII